MKKRHTSLLVFSGIWREIRKKIHQKFPEKNAKFEVFAIELMNIHYFNREKVLAIFDEKIEIRERCPVGGLSFFPPGRAGASPFAGQVSASRIRLVPFCEILVTGAGFYTIDIFLRLCAPGAVATWLNFSRCSFFFFFCVIAHYSSPPFWLNFSDLRSSLSVP